MAVRTYSSLNDFLADARPFLYEREVENGSIIGRLELPVDLFLTVAQEGHIVFAAVRFVPASYPPLLAVTADRSGGAAVDTLFSWMKANGQLYKVVHFIGPVQEASRFADLFNQVGDRRLTLHSKLSVHMLTGVNQFVLTNPAIPGVLREATLDDVELASHWSQSFDKDAQQPQAEYSQVKEKVTALIKDHKLFFWVAPVITLQQSHTTGATTTSTTSGTYTTRESGITYHTAGGHVSSTVTGPLHYGISTYTAPMGSSYAGLISSSYASLASSSYSSSYSSLMSSSYSSLASSSYAALSSSSYSSLVPSSYSSLMSSSYSALAPSSYSSLVSSSYASSYSSLMSSSYASISSSFSPTTYSGYHHSATGGSAPPLFASGTTASSAAGLEVTGPTTISWVPVCMVAISRTTQNTDVIGQVYTPHEYRRRGFATKLVAAVSQRILDNGKRYVTLLADTSISHLYRVIGFDGVSDLHVYHVK